MSFTVRTCFNSVYPLIEEDANADRSGLRAVSAIPDRLGQAALGREVAASSTPRTSCSRRCCAHAAGPPHNREPAVIAAWLRRILARTLADVGRQYDADKRAVGLEQSLTADLDRSASGLEGWLAADQTSPSGGAARNEELVKLAEALAELPDPQREVVVLKHLQGKTLADIAQETGKSVAAVAGLLRRGLESLRARLQED